MTTNPPRKNDWRPAATIGVGIGIAMAATKLAEKILTPHIGAWPAFGVGVLVVLLLAAIFGNLVNRLVLGKKTPPSA